MQRKELKAGDDQARDVLLSDLQNLIFALGFEKGPQPKGSIQNDSLVFFAIIEAAFFLEPLPWQKIKVAEGPKHEGMYEVLKAARLSLLKVNSETLNAAKLAYEGQYDVVQPLLGGAISLKNGYAIVARAFGTVKDQPGYLVEQMLLRVENLLLELSEKYTSSTMLKK